MQTANPVMNSIEKHEFTYETTVKAASFKGIAAKAFLCIFIAIGAGMIAPFVMTEALMWITLAFSGIGAFILVLVGMRSVKTAPVCTILYCVFQGLMLGVMTYIVDYFLTAYADFNHVGLAALIGVGSIFLVMFALYYFGIIKPTRRLASFVLGSLIAIIICSVILMFLPNVFDHLGIAIGFSAFCIIIGALVLSMDFARADAIVKSGAPAAYEWQVVLGLMVTLIWLYVEILRLIVLLVGRSNR